MSNEEADRLELLERQLAERITERVRPALFRLYATVGVAVIGALGFVSWDMVEDTKAEIKSEIKAEITNAIDQEIATKRIEILEQVTETRIMAKRVNKVILQVEKQLEEFQPQAEDLNETIAKVQELNVTSQNLIAAYSQEVQPLAENIESLSSQLKALAEQVKQLNSVSMPVETIADEQAVQTSQQRNAAIQSVITNTSEAQERLEQARDTTTVFFQFAGGRREQAQELSAALKIKGYIVPAEDRESNAVGKHEVRYFYEQDQEAAQRLANDANRALDSLTYPKDRAAITAKSLVHYRGKKPRPGVLELWLEMATPKR